MYRVGWGSVGKQLNCQSLRERKNRTSPEDIADVSSVNYLGQSIQRVSNVFINEVVPINFYPLFIF